MHRRVHKVYGRSFLSISFFLYSTMTTPLSGTTHNSADNIIADVLTLPMPPLLDDRSTAIIDFAKISPITTKRSLYDQQILDGFPKNTLLNLIHSSTPRRRQSEREGNQCVDVAKHYWTSPAEHTQSVPPSHTAKPPIGFYFKSRLMPPPFPGVLPIIFPAEKGLDVSGTHNPALCL